MKERLRCCERLICSVCDRINRKYSQFLLQSNAESWRDSEPLFTHLIFYWSLEGARAGGSLRWHTLCTHWVSSSGWFEFNTRWCVQGVKENSLFQGFSISHLCQYLINIIWTGWYHEPWPATWCLIFHPFFAKPTIKWLPGATLVSQVSLTLQRTLAHGGEGERIYFSWYVMML